MQPVILLGAEGEHRRAAESRLRDEGLRVEEVIAPATLRDTLLAHLLPKSRDYLVMATHTNGAWVFNPPDEHIITAGTALVMMTGPGGRAGIEKRLKA